MKNHLTGLRFLIVCLFFLTFLNIDVSRVDAQSFCSSNICINYDASGCYTYDSTGGNVGQTTLTLANGAQRKTISILNSNPASLFQSQTFNSPDYNCALGVIDTYYRVERVKADFVTPQGLVDFPGSSAWPVPGTRFLYYGIPSAVASVAIPPNPDTIPPFYTWNYLTRLKYSGLTDLSSPMPIASEDAVINNININHTLNLRFRAIYYSNGTVAEPQFVNTSVPATNCVKLSGTGAERIVISRPTAISTLNDFMWKAIDLRDEMVTAGTPSQYSFFLDIKKHDQVTFVSSQSSCGTGFSQYVFVQTTPIITIISPATSTLSGNIVISGSNFASTGNTIQFTNIATAQVVTVPNVPSSGTSVALTIPGTLVKGSYTVKVQTAANTLWSNGVSLQVKESITAPSITSAVKQQNPSRVVITGFGFSATGNSIQFIYKADTSKIYEVTNIPSINSGTRLTFKLPDDMPSTALFETYNVKVGALDSDWSNQLPFPILPQLGMYQNKLDVLQASVVVAKNIMQGKRDKVLMEQKGAEVLNVSDQINGPLFLLKKLEKYIETDANGSLKDHAGFVKFFTYLRFLKKFTDPALQGVFQSANEMTGFSYLFPPSPNKPMLISVAGAGGEGGWRGARSLLSAESTNFNIVVYTLDASALSGEMTDIFLSKFIASGLTEQESVFVTLSMGSTFIHSAILKDMQNNKKNFSKSYMVVTGFLPGGAQEFVGLASVIVPVMPYAYPISRGIADVMNPLNPVYTNIANNIREIATNTKGIFYIQASNDHHTSNTITSNPYATNRDKTLLGMVNKIYVTPPNNYINNDGLVEQNNQHINLLYAPEVKSKIDGYRTLLAQSPVIGNKNQSATSFWGVPAFVDKVLKSLRNLFDLKRFFGVVSAQNQSSEIEFDMINDIFGGPKQSICTSSIEVLRDSLLISDMDYDTYASEISKYISLTNSGCTIDKILEASVAELQVLPLSTDIKMSGATNLSFALDLTGVTSVDLVIDGNVASTDTTFPWNPLLDSTKFSNGSHTAKVIFHFSASKPSVTTKETSIQIDNGNLLTASLTASPTAISSGQTSTLTWKSVNATSCTAEGAWAGTKLPSGTLPVTPTFTSTYNLNCTGLGGNVSKSATIVVNSPSPTISISARLGGKVLTSAEAGRCSSNFRNPNFGNNNYGSCVRTLSDEITMSTNNMHLNIGDTYKVEWLGGYPSGADVTKKPTVTAQQKLGTNPITFFIDFLTPPPPTLTLSPNLNSSYKVGDILPIRWTVGAGVDKININLLNYKGNTVIRTIATVSAALGQYDWKISDIDFNYDSVYTISISDASNPALKSKSGKIDFIPAPVPVTVLPWTSIATVSPGQTLNYTLNWSGGALDKSWKVFVHLVKDDNSHTLTGGDFWPNPATNTWTGNVRTTASVTIPTGTPIGTYKVMVGLYDGNQRVQNLVDGKGVTVDTQYRHEVGSLEIIEPVANEKIQSLVTSVIDAIQGFLKKLFGFN